MIPIRDVTKYKISPPLRGAVVRGARQHAPRRLMGGASSAFLAARGARGGSSCYCCSACAECSGLGCRTAAAALRVAGGAGVVLQPVGLQFLTLQQTCVLEHYVRSIIAFRTRGTLHIQTRFLKTNLYSCFTFFCRFFVRGVTPLMIS